MTGKKVPMRTCIACRACKEKKGLLRIVKTNEGIVPDASGKLSGRGAYVCYDSICVAKMKKTKALNRAFSCDVPESVYDGIEETIKSENKS